jgi:PhoH-like ATPase
MAKKNYVIDTSVFLSDADCIYKFGNSDIFVSLKVLEEIDKHKKRQDSVGYNARKIIKSLDSLRSRGCLSKGVRIRKAKGLLRVVKAGASFPSELDKGIADHIILSSALSVSKEYPARRTIMVSRDINMRVISDSIGVPSEGYSTDQVVADTNKIYSGFVELVVDDELIDQFYDGEDVVIPKCLATAQKVRLFPHQFIMMISSANEKKTALGRFINHSNPLVRTTKWNGNLDFGVVPRNKEQSFAYELLFDSDIPLVSLIGKAGSGKTLMAISAGFEQTLGVKGAKYNKLVVSRPVQPLGKDIGFLPGTLNDKMLPWLMPIQDNMQFLLGNDKVMLGAYMEKGLIELEALTYIRGRSINNAYVIIDEAQNLTAHEVKTIITRVGENTKIVLTGDIEQIDNVYTNETSNGLTYAVEKFKYSDLAGHITFTKGERSKIATLASKIL